MDTIYLTHRERLWKDLKNWTEEAGVTDVASVTIVPDETGDGARVYVRRTLRAEAR